MPTTSIEARDQTTAIGAAIAVVCGDPTTEIELSSFLNRQGLHVALSHSAAELAHARMPQGLADVLVYACPDLAPNHLRRLVGCAAWLEVSHRVVVVAEMPPAHVVRRAVQGQVEGIVLRADVEAALLPTIEGVLAGQVVLPAPTREGIQVPMLSHREREVLDLAVAGYTNDEIGRQLFLATSTVKSHLSAAFVKLNVSSRKEAAVARAELLAEQPPLMRNGAGA